MNILVVDDDRDAADSLATFLKVMGHRLTVCYTAEEGISTSKGLEPDVIVHDLGMPMLDGYGAVAHLRSLPAFAHTLIVAVTASNGKDARARAARAGFDEFLTKPADLERLLRLLSDWEIYHERPC